MTIKNVMLGLLAILSIFLLIAQLNLFTSAYEASAKSNRAAVSSSVTDNLLTAGKVWALERGLTNAALNDANPAGSETLQKIAELRKSANESYENALKNLAPAELEMSADYQQRIDSTQQALQAIREAIDSELQLPKGDRISQTLQKWVPTITAHILETQKLRFNLSSQALTGDAILGKDTLMRHSVWMITEYAGRERALIAGTIASGEPISADRLQILMGFRSKVEEGWSIVSNIYLDANEHAVFDGPVSEVKDKFFTVFENVRQTVYAEGKLGAGYSVNAQEWIAASTAAIDTVFNLQNVSAQTISTIMTEKQTVARREMLFYGLVLFLSVAVVSCALGVILIRVVRPINKLASSMQSIASGQFGQEVPYLTRKDEIGFMSKSVEIFRKNGEEKIRLEQQAKERELQMEREKKRAMNELADTFQSHIGSIVDSVSAAATELPATATNLSNSAEETSHQTKTVLAASGQASANVQTVSAATEELTASIREIQTRIAESTGMVGQAAEQANFTNAKVQELADAADRIGTVVNLIGKIAEQTNLLALNATIEAARAGEAGKGFAVVASEVKTLANQTAKATEEITSQIKNVQGSTKDSIDVIRKITEKIHEVNHASTAIAAAVEQQGAATQEIARNISQAADGTKEVSTSIATANEAVQLTGAAATQVLSAASELSKNGETLKLQVGNFLEQVRSA